MNNKSKTLIIASLSIVYVWFGLLKILGVSPVAQLVKQTYPSFPDFMVFLGIWEILIGLFLINKKTLKLGLILMWIQLSGIFFGAIINIPLYFTDSNLLYPNLNGEFVIKNLVLIAASYSLWEN